DAGWTGGRFGRPDAIEPLLDVPVPVESWEVFDRLFAWDGRSFPGGQGGGTYLGAAVRSFFAQGGRRCYVVRVGDPWTYGAPRAQRAAALDALFPGRGGSPPASPAERRTWRGAAHLFGLPDVSFLALPDLADAVAAEPAPILPLVTPVPPPERFVECSAGEAPREPDRAVRRLRAPRADEAGFALWAAAVREAALLLQRHRREVQLVAAIPLPTDDLALPGSGETQYLPIPSDDGEPPPSGESPGEGARGRFLARDQLLRFLAERGYLRGVLGEREESLASAFVQLAWPWLRTPGGGLLPEGVEGAEGALVGMLARNALVRGSYRSAAGQDAGDVRGVFPVVTADQLQRPLQDRSGEGGPERALADRVSLFGPTPRGVRLLSDVTTARDESWRPAGVGRLVAAIVRAARRLGEASAFEPAGERMWREVEEGLGELLMGLLQAGALRGRTVDDAFEVRCDRTTMTQNDLDAGRVVARVTIQPAAPVEEIVVVLAVGEAGGARPAAAREAA
ncbi:MAG TPA: hypothetical protein VF541_08725, partial [Longimicrobium sp.]